MNEKDNQVYYDKKINKLYTITWEDWGNRDVPTRHYLDLKEIKQFKSIAKKEDLRK